MAQVARGLIEIRDTYMKFVNRSITDRNTDSGNTDVTLAVENNGFSITSRALVKLLGRKICLHVIFLRNFPFDCVMQ